MIRRDQVLSVTYAAMLLILACAAAQPSKAEKVDVQKAVARLIVDLDSGKFAVRRLASQKLSRMGQVAVAPLAKAAEQGSLEVAVRAIALLETFFTGENEAAAYEAESALENLAASENLAVARRAQSVLAAHQELREERALAAFLKLGGVKRLLPRRTRNGLPFCLLIGERWKGGDEGLKYVKRLPRLEHLYRIDGSGVSEKAWEDLTAAMPTLRIQRRGPAFLGINGHPIPKDGCPVNEVTPGSAAQKGGMLKGDVITSLAGKKVADFDSLIEIIKTKKAGDKVVIEVRRGGKMVKLQITLDGWK